MTNLVIKTSLSAAIARKFYNVEAFTTIVKEVESIVNMRPLTYQSTESRDQWLMPSQLLCGLDISIIPPLLQLTLTTWITNPENFDTSTTSSAMRSINSEDAGLQKISHPFVRSTSRFVREAPRIISSQAASSW